MLDMLCLTGEVGWARLSPAGRPSEPGASLVPATPIALFLREHADAWQTLRRDRSERAGTLGEPARRVAARCCDARGASFFARSRGRPAASTPTSCGTRSARWSPAGLVDVRRLRRFARARLGGARTRRRSTIGAATSPAAGRLSRGAATRPTRDDGGRAPGVDAAAPLRRRLPPAADARDERRDRGASWRASTAGSRRAARSAAAGS